MYEYLASYIEMIPNTCGLEGRGKKLWDFLTNCCGFDITGQYDHTRLNVWRKTNLPIPFYVFPGILCH